MIKHGAPQGSILGPTLFLLYINDLPAVINKKAIPVLFADDTSILCIHHNLMEYHVDIETVFENVNRWFNKNCLSLNNEKTHYIHFKTKNSQPTDISICLDSRVGTLIVATIYLQLIQNRYMFRSFTVLQCSHQHCVQPVASDLEVVGYL